MFSNRDDDDDDDDVYLTLRSTSSFNIIFEQEGQLFFLSLMGRCEENEPQKS